MPGGRVAKAGIQPLQGALHGQLAAPGSCCVSRDVSQCGEQVRLQTRDEAGVARWREGHGPCSCQQLERVAVRGSQGLACGADLT